VKLGLFGINTGVCADPEVAAAVARAAEAAGFESLWTAEHVVLPDPQTPDSPIPAQTPLLDPTVALAHVAAHTRSIRLATGIIILPQRNPVVLAKALASVDVVSGGRLILGVGAGYLQSEYQALGVPFEGRGERMDEYIEAIRALWVEKRPRFQGRYVAFEGIDAQPRPVQQPHPPIVLGGTSPPALRRAARCGNGWYGFALDLETTASCIAQLREAQEKVDRPGELGPLEITLTPAGPLDEESLARLAELGVHRVVTLAAGGTPEEVLAFVKETGSRFGSAGA
jgi:probable F420-dependent oxidoreductase